MSFRFPSRFSGSTTCSHRGLPSTSSSSAHSGSHQSLAFGRLQKLALLFILLTAFSGLASSCTHKVEFVTDTQPTTAASEKADETQAGETVQETQGETAEATAAASNQAGTDASDANPADTDASGANQTDAAVSDANPEAANTPSKEFQMSQEPTNYVDILVDSGNHIIIELLPDKAPISVENFKKLVSAKFYDGLIFHRIIDGFMIQGGGPEFVGRKDQADTIKGEFASNGVKGNDISHKRGVVSMARTPDKDSASSQFFICNGDSEFLDGEYAAFGRVLSGMEEVDRIAKLPKDGNDFPKQPPVIQSITFVEPK